MCSVNRCSHLAKLSDCEGVLPEGGPVDGVATLNRVLRDGGVDAMCGVVRHWRGRSHGVLSFLTYVGACGVVVGACGCTFGTCVGVEAASECAMI